MSSKSKQSGFTIIEVTLFIAITGLLLLIALVGTGGTIATTRFGDSVRSLESYFEQQYDLIVNGANLRSEELGCSANGHVSDSDPVDLGTSDNCVLLGKFFTFQDDDDFITAYEVVGTPPNEEDGDESERDLIVKYEPRIVTFSGLPSRQDIVWHASIINAARFDRADAANPLEDVNALALLRGPRSGAVHAYAFTWTGGEALKDNLESRANRYIGDQNYLSLCLLSADNGAKAAVQIGGGQGQANVTSIFDIKESRVCHEII